MSRTPDVPSTHAFPTAESGQVLASQQMLHDILVADVLLEQPDPPAVMWLPQHVYLWQCCMLKLDDWGSSTPSLRRLPSCHSAHLQCCRHGLLGCTSVLVAPHGTCFKLLHALPVHKDCIS